VTSSPMTLRNSAAQASLRARRFRRRRRSGRERAGRRRTPQHLRNARLSRSSATCDAAIRASTSARRATRAVE
jgi:hypothetical protein